MEDRPLSWQGKVVAVVQERVAVKLKRVAMEPIGATLNCFVNDSSGVTAVFRILRAGEEGDLAEGVGVNHDALLLQRTVVDVGAVEQVAVHLGLIAVRRVVAESVRGLDGAGGQLLEDGGIAAEQWQLLNLRGGDRGFELGIRGVHLERIGADLDGLRDGSGVQLAVDVAVLIDREVDAGGLKILESIFFNFHRIGTANGQLWKDEVAIVVGGCFGGEPGAGVGDGNGGAGENGSAGISDGAMDAGIGALRVKGRHCVKRQNCEKQGEEPATSEGHRTSKK